MILLHNIYDGAYKPFFTYLKEFHQRVNENNQCVFFVIHSFFLNFALTIMVRSARLT